MKKRCEYPWGRLFLQVLIVAVFSCISISGNRKATVGTEADIGSDGLYMQFLHPPAEAKPWVRWWWNGDAVTEREILRQLDLLKDAGIGGVEINPVAMPEQVPEPKPVGLEWLSPEWNRMVKVAARGARERGMKADLIVGSGWPFGGRFLSPGEKIKAVGVSEKILEGPGVFDGNIKDVRMLPRVRRPLADASEPELLYLRLVPKNAKDIGDCMDLTGQVKTDGSVRFDIPPGSHVLHIGMLWEGFRAVVHGAPGSDGPILDHLSKAAVERYLERMSKELGQVLGGRMGNALRAMFCDSIELAGANWTSDFTQEFRQRRGYDLEPWLPFALYDPYEGYKGELPEDPGLVAEIRRVRYDFNKTFIELFHERFIKTFHRWCRANGMQSRYQAYGSPGLMGMLGGYMIPDIPEGDTWLYANPNAGVLLDDIRYAVWNKYASSGAHLTGKRLVGCEAMTNTNGVFRTTLEYLKQAGDLNFITGINHSILHGFNYSPADASFPGWIRYGTYFNENNPWWPHFHLWAEYHARLAAVLQNSQPSMDIAILGPTADVWSIAGVQRQIFIDTPEYLHQLWQSLHQNGYNADYVNANVLEGASFEGGKLCYGPMEYEVLMVAGVKALEPQTAQAMERFAASDGKIVFIGRTPTLSPGLKDREINDRLVRTSVANILNDSSSKAKVVAEPDKKGLLEWTASVLYEMGIFPSVKITPANQLLFQTHNRLDDRDIFFFSNQNRKETVSFQARFREDKKIPWIWDAETGQRSVYPFDSHPSRLNIELKPLESLLLIFEPHRFAKPILNPEQDKTQFREVDTPWVLSLDPIQGKPFMWGELKNLNDLAAFTDNRVRNFAGTATYRTELTIEDAWYEQLDLGNVHGVSRVILNGRPVGTRWWGDHSYDVEDSLLTGNNVLEVEVVTVLFNYCRSLKDNPVAMRWALGEKSEPMGLIGPVRFYRVK